MNTSILAPLPLETQVRPGQNILDYNLKALHTGNTMHYGAIISPSTLVQFMLLSYDAVPVE